MALHLVVLTHARTHTHMKQVALLGSLHSERLNSNGYHGSGQYFIQHVYGMVVSVCLCPPLDGKYRFFWWKKIQSEAGDYMKYTRQAAHCVH